MNTPVVIDGLRFRWFVPPKLGETIHWGLSWNPDSRRRWAALKPPWSCVADVRRISTPIMQRLTADPDVVVAQQPSIGRAGGLQFMFNSDLPVPAKIEVSGALHLLAGTARENSNARQAWLDFDVDALTTGVVRRLRLVSIASDMQPDARQPHDSHWGWASMQFVSGTEQFYELAHPPQGLRSYKLTDRENGPYREDFLVVDLETV